MTDEELIVKITSLEERIKRNEKEMEEIKDINKEIRNLSESILIATTEIKNMSEEVNGLKKDVEELKMDPANRWKLVVNGLIAGVVAVIVSLILK